MEKSKNNDHKLDITDIDTIKDSLENVCLYLNEIENIINTDINNDERQYKLQQLEQYLLDIDTLFISMDIANSNHKIKFN